MKLSKLFENFESYGVTDREISNIRYNSKEVKPGDVFVAIKGYITDGHEYIQDAKNRGAVIAVVEDRSSVAIDQVQVDNSRQTLAMMSDRYFDHPSKKLDLVGITATNGKTTTSFMVDAIYREAGYTTGIIGTVYTKYADVMVPSILTTPESYDLQEFLADMAAKGIEKVNMEVSSSGQELYRNYGIAFDIVTFNNFSREHIDQHGSFEAYLKYKSRLIKDAPATTVSVLNMDFEAIADLKSQTSSQVLAYSLEHLNEDCGIKNLDLSTGFGKYTFCVLRPVHTTKADLEPMAFDIELGSSGYASVMNSMAAIIVGLLEGIEPEVIQRALKKFTGVERRSEIIFNDHFKILDDHFANVRNIEVTLDTLKQMDYDNLHVLYAIRGSRGVHLNEETSEKMCEIFRQLNPVTFMATKSEETVSKKDVVTEEEEAVFKRVTNAHGFDVPIYRRLDEAIAAVLDRAEEGDIVLLAGCQGMDKGAGVVYKVLKDRYDVSTLAEKVKNRVC
ncbi:Mur ligase family protein [Peptoniphilus equinus]|uniref:Mur ligase family protein n=1 Tax=Peptoniphilus equinus TaxID=3016343 RepID=A0ABY7QWA7_9FIRM|nr:Mur ligase family protein [Peptoniphilus equinus]WBW50656.1 Mur ligase family protein [Peptoniphilus equinus]